MKNVIIFGLGGLWERYRQKINKKFNIIAYTDNNEANKLKLENVDEFISVNKISMLNYDKIIVCSSFFEEIRNQLISSMKIDEEKIINLYEYINVPNGEYPEIYNAAGEKIHVYYLKDTLSRHYPYCFTAGRYPKRISWDRFNYGLKTHFYSHENILHIKGEPIKKFAHFIESEAIVPNDYLLFDKNKGLNKEFDKIFTHSEYLLNKYENACFMPAAGVWYGTQWGGGVISSDKYLYKNKNISMVSSNKKMCELHKFRLDLCNRLKLTKLADTFGTFDGGKNIKISKSLDDYRYSIIIENSISSYYFTEKILNCFASMTIPIYIGATKISEYFNIDGIIQLNSLDYNYIDSLLNHCNEKDYISRIEAIKDNFNRVQKYLTCEDYLFEQYGDILE